MPELPEVETIVRSLRAGRDQSASLAVTGRTITRAEVLWPRSLATPSINEFQSRIINQKIQAVNRRGKFILFKLSQQTLLIHLRMSGDIIVESGETGRDAKHDRVILFFEDGTRLVFNDTRKFGRMWLVDDPQSVIGELGPEPLEDSLSAKEFHAKLHQTKRRIKPLLLEQSFLAGLGNIYTDEALHKARIHPCTLANSLDVEQAASLLSAIRHVLNEGIRRNGASIDWVYRGGDFQNYFQVYQRDGQPCYHCGTTIERITIGQRGTHFCPCCQTEGS